MTAPIAMMMTLTFIMTIMMLPKVYWAWLKTEELYVEGELWKLRLLQAEENNWVRRHFGYGTVFFIFAWLSKHGAVTVPDEMTAVLALYSAISLSFALAESYLARRIDLLSRTLPVPAQAERE